MNRPERKSPFHARSVERNRPARKPLKLSFEALEDRLMLDAGASASLPPAIVVGRTLTTPATAQTATPSPSYFLGEVQNHQVTVRYTVYNEQAGTETGVLLTTTLEPGVSIVSSSVTLDGTTTTQLPDQSGQNLAWSLQPIQGYDRESVAVTLNLQQGVLDAPAALALDTGAHAYAMLNAGAVSNSTPAAVLKPGNVSDPALLASTPDANTTDPFIQEEAAKLNYDPQQIFDFLHTQVGYNSYLGSLRGARGTLWSSAGNALDVASLGVALMRASGIPSQYASGTLSQSQAQTLILSMFPASYQTVGYIPAGTQVSDPANDPQLLSETESHYWFQFDPGTGMTDADSLMEGAKIGQTFTAATGTFAEVPVPLRHTVEVKLIAEIATSASSLFGLGPSTTTVLDQSFNTADLVGKTLTIGNFVKVSQLSALAIGSETITYSPYLVLSEIGGDPASGPIIRGQDYQEVFGSLPLSSHFLTGLFLDVSTRDPGTDQAVQTQTTEKTLFDRIGFAARQTGGGQADAPEAGTLPAIAEFDTVTLAVSPSLQLPSPLVSESSALDPVLNKLNSTIPNLDVADPATSENAFQQARFAAEELVPYLSSVVLGSFLAESDNAAVPLASDMLAYVWGGQTARAT
jgi:transglutaminase-like putative cysteine protease